MKLGGNLPSNFLLLFIFIFGLALDPTNSQACLRTDGQDGSIIQLEFTEATAEDLSENPTSSLYNRPLGLQGPLTEAKLTLLAASSTPTSLIGQPSDLFTVVQTTDSGLELRLVAPLDRDADPNTDRPAVDSFLLVLQCSSTATSNNATVQRDYILAVRVLDVNDNGPEFVNAPYRFTVNELAPVNTVVYQKIKSRDVDLELNSQISYSLQPVISDTADGSDNFTIDSKTGDLLLAVPLDYEALPRPTQRPHYLLNVSAMDNPERPEERRTAYVTVEVTVGDGDDLPPAFIYTGCRQYAGSCVDAQYQSSATSVEITGDGVLTVSPENIKAEDRDSLKSEINYSFISGVPEDYADYLSINPTTGLITQNKPIDRALIKNLSITIMARENTARGYYDLARLTVQVRRPTTSTIPRLVASSGELVGFIEENSPGGALLMEREMNKPLRLFVEGQDDSNSLKLQILDNSTLWITDSGYLSLVSGAKLDYEQTTGFNVDVLVYDAGVSTSRTSTGRVSVHIVDVNDNTPMFPDGGYQLTITSGDVRSNILKVEARDSDSGQLGEVSYKLLDVAPASYVSSFNITEQQGQLSIISSLVVSGPYTLLVQAEDRDPVVENRRRSTTLVKITLVGEGDGSVPRFSSPRYEISVSEGALPGSTVFIATVVNGKLDDHAFSLKSGEVNRTFDINSQTGTITTAGSLDRESLDHYSMIIVYTIISTNAVGIIIL